MKFRIFIVDIPMKVFYTFLLFERFIYQISQRNMRFILMIEANPTKTVDLIIYNKKVIS